MKFRHTRIFMCSLPLLLFLMYYISHRLRAESIVVQESPWHYQLHPHPHPQHPQHPSDEEAPHDLLPPALPHPHPPSLSRTLPKKSLAHPHPHQHHHDQKKSPLLSSPGERCFPIPSKFPLSAPFFPCAWFSSPSPPSCSQRLRAKLQCQQSRPVRMVFEWVSVDTPPAAYEYEDACLERAVKDLCYLDGKDLIPNLSHQVLFGGRPLVNYTFLAFISAARFLQPCMLMVHADRLPTGPFWDTLVRLLPRIIHVMRQPPKVIFGNKIERIEHSSDVARLEAVRKFGGVYQDTDYLLLSPIDDLRPHSVVMGESVPKRSYGNCVYMAKAGAPFLHAWYDSYRTFRNSDWDFHSTRMPYKIHRSRPELEFHEVKTLVTPNFQTIEALFYKRFYNWKRLHGIHIYTRLFRQYFQGHYETGNSSLGQVCRHVLFGDSEACLGGEEAGSEGGENEVVRFWRP